VPEAIEPLGELLADLDVDDPEALARAVVTLPVASSLRAALDWIGADLGGPLHSELGESALMLVARATHEPGLGPAGAILALTGGALLPAPDGRWALRVPLHVSRPAFLLARQGALALAIPWHAVARLTIVDDAARSVMTEPSLSPWSPLARAEGERPAALLALGLARAWLHLDHIVWRVFARPEPVEATDNVPGGRQVVRDDGGEGYRVVEVDEALRGVPPLHTPPPQPRPHATPSVVEPLPRAEAPAAPAPRAAPGAEAPVLDPTFRLGALLSGPPPVAEAAPTSGGSQAPARAPLVLGPESVRPLGRAASARTTTPQPSARGPAPEASIPAAAAPAVRRALVVDDSLIARMELGRVLEREGWTVEWVESAAEMWGALGEGDWSAVFVDVFLPDAAGRAHLRQLVARQGLSHVRAELVALTRDSSEELLVRGTGITRVLRKPFVAGAVDKVVREISAAGR
jgi:CheY-like chemotaxis protein